MKIENEMKREISNQLRYKTFRGIFDSLGMFLWNAMEFIYQSVINSQGMFLTARQFKMSGRQMADNLEDDKYSPDDGYLAISSRFSRYPVDCRYPVFHSKIYIAMRGFRTKEAFVFLIKQILFKDVK